MEKRSTKIAYFVALGIFIVLLVILGLQFKGKENPVFVGGGAFYTTGDGVFLDGILKTADDSEGSKYALDGSYYVSPEAGTYFELSEDGNTMSAPTVPSTSSPKRSPRTSTAWSTPPMRSRSTPRLRLPAPSGPCCPPSWPSCWP